MTAPYRISRVILPATSPALVTIDQAKEALGIPLDDMTRDAAVQAQIDQVSAAVARYCDRQFVVQTYRDQLRAVCSWLRWGEPLPTMQKPIAEAEGVPLITITENGAELDTLLYEVDAERGLLYRLDGAGAVAAWTGTAATLDYDAGYDPIPPDVQAATLEWVNARWSAQERDPALRSETIPDVISQVYGSVGGGDSAEGSSLPPGVRELLAPYRIMSI
jgi:hypothetical protein